MDPLHRTCSISLFITLSCFAASAAAFQISSSRPRTRHRNTLRYASAPKDDDATNSIVDRSTLSLLEHINFNVPDHDLAVPFYYDILGCGVDPRMAANFAIASNTAGDSTTTTSTPDFDSTIWANCGASQFHLCYNDQTPATIPGRIGLRYDSLKGLEQRLNEHVFEVLADQSKQCFQSFIQEQDSQGNPQIIVVDRYNNNFVCRTIPEPHPTSPVSFRQPILSNTSTTEYEDLAKKHGRSDSDCRGIDYVEIPVPPGTAEKIAEFYESVFDASVNVVPVVGVVGDTDNKIAMIALGNIMETGRADQYLLFKEDASASAAGNTLAAGHHHVAIYVGESAADFEQAYKNANVAGVVWINPRFEDKVDSLAQAKKEKQFRFKDIVDLETGKPILELEHEIRSIEHPSWPGHAKD